MYIASLLDLCAPMLQHIVDAEDGLMQRETLVRQFGSITAACVVTATHIRMALGHASNSYQHVIEHDIYTALWSSSSSHSR